MDSWKLFEQAATLHKRGDLVEAERLYRMLLEAHPRHGVVTQLLGMVRLDRSDLEDALELLTIAAEERPADPSILLDKGNVLQKLHRHDDALTVYGRALALKPGYPEVLNNRGNTLQAMGRFDEALADLDAALAAMPRHAQTWYNRANVLHELHRDAEAVDAYDGALAIQPDYPLALNNKGVALVSLERYDEALAVFELGLTLHETEAELWFNRGVAFQRLKRHAEALASHDRALALAPDHSKAFRETASSALYALDWPRMATIAAQLDSRAEEMQPWIMLGYCEDQAAQLRSARATVREKVPGPLAPLWTGTRYDHQRIRIAYVSEDFRNHPVLHQIVRLLEGRDRSRFELIGISSSIDEVSDIRSRAIAALDQFHEVRKQPPRQVAELIRSLDVDIAIDLGGHTEGDALSILAHRPAPVQASWLGYPGTTGADYMDYLIADRIVAPPEHQPFYSEKLWYLPDTFFPTDNSRAIGNLPARAEAGLPEEGFVFCSFNNSWKITPPVWDIWMRLLKKVPGSLLWLRHYGDGPADMLRREAAARGVAPERLIFAQPVMSPQDHAARQQLADLFLDNLPYNAHATAADALWAGLPIVTQLGKTFAGRVAASLLTAAGLPELITHSSDEYEALALALARDPARLAALKAKLAAGRDSCALFDTKRFTRNIEDAYVAMLREKTA